MKNSEIKILKCKKWGNDNIYSANQPVFCGFCGEKITETKKLNDLSWTEIKDILETGNGAAHFEIGDEKDETLYTGEEIKIKLISLSTQDKYAAGGKAKAIFMFYLDGEFNMNEEYTNEGGWPKSKMRNVWIPRFWKLLPKELRDVISVVNKSASEGNSSSKILISSDKLFLPSEVEVRGADIQYSVSGEGEQYEYFKTNKMQDKWTWTRSAYRYGSGCFVDVYGDGSDYSGAGSCYRVALCFCI